jgi:probable O-glycosylation ligase (exosortase A-associated)
MRDIVIIGLVAWGSLAALRWPWIGIMVWTWLSIMNPHRLTWGIAYDAPLAAVAAGCTLTGLVFTRDQKTSPFKHGAVATLVFFMGWVTLSWRFGLDPDTDYWQWNKIMKIDGMILVGLMLLHTKQHILAMAWVTTASLAILGAKGGVFTILNAGAYRVWGPPDSFIEDNNEFALALVMTIPLLRFLQLQLTHFWARHGMTALMMLCAVSALGSQSRGAFLAISAMALLLWWRGKSRAVGGLLIGVSAFAMIAFMPDEWSTRMSTINDYGEDRSALGRISAWWNAWNLAFDYPFGVGFDAARTELFARYSPYPDYVHAAHSIYFQVLGNHGFIGLALFVSIWIATWFCGGWLRTHAAKIPEAQWCADLGSMCQVSMLGYAVGGAFLSLAYFDLPYNIMMMVVLAKVWVSTRAWEREPLYQPGWRTLPGLAMARKGG